MNWIISKEEQDKLNQDKLLNISLAFIGPDLTDQDIDYLLTYPPILDIMDI
jgi:hypothetical protein